MALAFGGLMLGAGVLLFVAAHWDTLSPGERFAMVVAMVAIFHGAGAVAASRHNRSFGIVMHGLGTASLGAAIFLTGQIFNLESHWPSGVMLWAAGAWIAWALRRDWLQLAIHCAAHSVLVDGRMDRGRPDACAASSLLPGDFGGTTAAFDLLSRSAHAGPG